MNRFIGMGRLTADPEVRYAQNENSTCIARYTLAIDRRGAKEGAQNVDFIRIVAFGKAGEFAEKYLHKGMKILVSGRVQVSTYEKDGTKFYNVEVVAEDQEFCERKESTSSAPAKNTNDDGFEDLPLDDLPFAPVTQ